MDGTCVSSWRCLEKMSIDGKSGPTTVVALKNVCRQMAQGLQFLSKYGIRHGDLRPSNVLMRLSGLDALPKAELITLVDEPVCFDAITSTHSNLLTEEEREQARIRAPRYCVWPAVNGLRSLYRGSVTIVDFGESLHADAPRRGTGITLIFSATENLLGVRAYFESDIWSLACTIYQLRDGRDLFAQLPPLSGPYTPMSVVSSWNLFLGPLVDPYRTIYRSRFVKDSSCDADDRAPEEKDREDGERSEGLEDSEYSDILEAELGSGGERWLRIDPDEPGPLDEVTRYRWSRDEVTQLADLLRKM